MSGLKIRETLGKNNILRRKKKTAHVGRRRKVLKESSYTGREGRIKKEM